MATVFKSPFCPFFYFEFRILQSLLTGHSHQTTGSTFPGTDTEILYCYIEIAKNRPFKSYSYNLVEKHDTKNAQ